MKRLLVTTVLAVSLIITACTSTSWYAGHPTTAEELLRKRGKPDRIERAGDGPEKWIYRFEADGVVHMFWLIENGMVVRTGIY